MQVILKDWQIVAIKQELCVSKSKRNPNNYSMGISINAELELQDLIVPAESLNRLHAEVCANIARKRAAIAGILESRTRVEWLQRRGKLLENKESN